MAALLGQQSLQRCCNGRASLPLRRVLCSSSFAAPLRLRSGGQGRCAHLQNASLRYRCPARSIARSLATHAHTNACSSNHALHRARRIEHPRACSDRCVRSISSTSGPRHPEKVGSKSPKDVFQNFGLLCSPSLTATDPTGRRSRRAFDARDLAIVRAFAKLATVERLVQHLGLPMLITAIGIRFTWKNEVFARDAIRLRHHILLRSHCDRQMTS
jgi:hypothetical protein